MMYIPGRSLRPHQMRAIRNEPLLKHISLEEIPRLGFLLATRGSVPRTKLIYPLTIPKKDITRANKALAEGNGNRTYRTGPPCGVMLARKQATTRRQSHEDRPKAAASSRRSNVGSRAPWKAVSNVIRVGFSAKAK
jgi:hypothetical protein